jgi:hypothetical protein
MRASMHHLITLACVLTVAACSSTGGSHSEASKVPAAQPQCDFVNYHHAESINVQGAGQCATDCDCDGMRSCIGGACSGTARPVITNVSQCDDPNYHWNETWNGGGDGVCANDCECNGTRTCVNGHCQGQ